MILRKPKELRCVAFVDALYGNRYKGRRSVSGEIHTLGGMTTAFSSRTQKTIHSSFIFPLIRYITTISLSWLVRPLKNMMVLKRQLKISIVFEDTITIDCLFWV